MLLEQEPTTVDETSFLMVVDNDLTIIVNHEQCGGCSQRLWTE